MIYIVIQKENMSVGEHRHTTVRGGVVRSWLVEDLWKLAEGLPVKEVDPMELPEIEHFLGSEPVTIWGRWNRERQLPDTYTVQHMLEDVTRILEADLSYPIILNPLGGFMDGCHRIMKALATGQKVLVQQFVDWPPTQ
jgi:hypothetical protein